MSQENVVLVRALIDRWNTGARELSAFRQYVDPAFELESPFASVVGEPYRGYAGLERWLRDNDEQFAEWRIEADDLRDLGDQVIVVATVTARGRESGVALHFPSAAVFEFASDGRVLRTRIYGEVDAALKAVGLAE
jgi:ketosteroid isomerase-like protein